MENSKGSSNVRNLMYSGKHALLPPKSPFPSVSPSYVDYVPSNVIGSKAVQRPRQASPQHQRTSSETLFTEEQPSWLDDLLDEPESPIRRGGHRRSSSDSFAYVDVANASNIDYASQDQYKFKNMMSIPSWDSQDFGYHKDAHLSSLYGDLNLAKQKNRAWEPLMNTVARSTGLPAMRENIYLQNSGSSCSPPEVDGVASSPNERQDFTESTPPDPKALTEKKDSHAKPSTSETDTKRSKQQFAQRSRVRKLQYIAELERNVQALQVEGSEVSAELEFLNQRNLILSMENKALKQRLENLSQEQLIKYLEREVLEREIGRLQALHQQHQQQPSSSHRRSKSRDLDSQFANLSLKHKDASSGRDPVTGSLPTQI